MVTASFLAVVFVVMEYKATATLTFVAAEGVDTVLLAAAIILGALVLVCRGANKGRPQVCAGLKSGQSPQGKWEAWLGFLPPGAGWGARGQGDVGSGPAPSVASLGGPAVGRKSKSGVEGGPGLQLTSVGTLYHYLLTGQTDK